MKVNKNSDFPICAKELQYKCLIISLYEAAVASAFVLEHAVDENKMRVRADYCLLFYNE